MQEEVAGGQATVTPSCTVTLVGLPDVPEGASINEAVELAKCYSTSDSSRFVNGLLGRLATRTGTERTRAT